MPQAIYLDHNASTPLAPEVIAAMTPCLQTGFGNPSSTHTFGQASKRLVETAREQVAALLGCRPEEIIFTSGGTESNNLAIRGVAEMHPGGHIITSAIEHPSVLEVCRYLERQGHRVTYLPVDSDGMLDPDDVTSAINSDTCLISIMLANNEVGTLEPLREIARIAQAHGIICHTDAAQATGKIKIDIAELGVDLLSLAGHKMMAPKGIGALYLKAGTSLTPLILGAGHEFGLRPGTENVLEIVGLGAAAALFTEKSATIQEHLLTLREHFWKNLQSALPEIRLNGHPTQRLPNTLNVCFAGLDASALLSALPGIAASTGAACHADRVTPSHVLQAMGRTTAEILGSVRFSVGRTNNVAEIDRAVAQIAETVKNLTGSLPTHMLSIPVEDVRLTQYTHGLGCACKLRPPNLEKILSQLSPVLSEKVLVGFDTSDDAAVYQLNDSTALVATVDFFTPIVDNPYDFGRIAAANALSDIYAMGATPLFGLNIVAFPEKRLPLRVLERILKGAESVCQTAHLPVIGGHSIEDNEPKFGLAVIGTVHPRKIIRNTGAQAGDALILTKPLGTGIQTTALKRGLLSPEQARELTELMATLNASATVAMQKFPVHACTDVTGFGLLGHLHEMLQGSSLGARIYVNQVPVISGTSALIRQNCIPGGTLANLEYANAFVSWEATIPVTDQTLLSDAQTSGGLLIAVAASAANALLEVLSTSGHSGAARIGEFLSGPAGKILVAQ